MSRDLTHEEQTVLLLKQMLAIELWRGGLSQAEIRKRLGLGMGAVTSLLKGVSREIDARSTTTE